MPASQKFPDAPVLILTPTGNDARNAAAVLAGSSIRAEICFDMARLCANANDQAGALLIGEESLTAESLQCLAEFLETQDPWSDIPIILVTKASEITHKIRGILDFLGTRANITLLEKLLRVITLISVVRSALRARDHQYQVRDLLESYSLAMEGAQMGSWDIDLRTQVTRRSARHDQIFGYDGMQSEWGLEILLQHVVEEDRDQARAVLSNAAANQMILFDTRIRHPDGSIHWIAVRGRVYSDEKGIPRRMAGIVTDITDRKNEEQLLRRAQQELKQTADTLEDRVKERTIKLEEAISEMEAFSYSISHDLRAPLRAMQGYSWEIINKYGHEMDPKAAEFLRRIYKSSERLDRLTQDLLTYSRVVRNPVALTLVDLSKLLPDILNQYPNFQTPNADIVILSPLHEVIGHEASLVQCISNIIANAIKFVPPGAKPRIKIWTESSGDTVIVWFEDNGIGIEPQHMARIFKIFERVSNQYEGTGIGLAIVRKAAERMNGKVGVDSTPGVGSKFWLKLPAVPEHKTASLDIAPLEHSGK